MLNVLLATCVIIYSGGSNGNFQEKREHEIWHCNGWVHPEQSGGSHKAFIAPKKYHHPYHGKLVEHHVTTEQAIDMCDGHFGCQYFE